MPKDPRPAKRKALEAAEVERAVAEQRMVDRTARIDAVRAENLDHFRAQVEARARRPASAHSYD